MLRYWPQSSIYPGPKVSLPETGQRLGLVLVINLRGERGHGEHLVQGPPGTGKTFTCLAILQRWLEQLQAEHSVREQERAVRRRREPLQGRLEPGVEEPPEDLHKSSPPAEEAPSGCLSPPPGGPAPRARRGGGAGEPAPRYRGGFGGAGRPPPEWSAAPSSSLISFYFP